MSPAALMSGMSGVNKVSMGVMSMNGGMAHYQLMQARAPSEIEQRRRRLYSSARPQP